MSDYVPDAAKQVAQQVDRCNRSALIHESSGPASINITNSSLHIGAGDNVQTNEKNSTVKGAEKEQQATNAGTEIQAESSKARASNYTQESSEILSKIATINQYSWEITSVRITEDCNDEKLNEPDFQAFPQMIKVNDYYKGGYTEVQQQELVELEAEGCLRPQQHTIRNQCIKERGFNVKYSTSQYDSITFESWLESILREKALKVGEKCDVTAVVASAGSGKTTLLRRLTRRIMEKNHITEENSFSAPHQSRFHMVQYIELKNVQDEESVSVADFLFGGMFENANDANDAYKWLLKNQSKAVLLLDGYDQTVCRIEKKNQVDIKPHQKAAPATIMHNLLSRNLLPHLEIVMTSREFAVSELQAKSRPKNIVTLTGLKQEDAKRLFIALIGMNGANAWTKLSNPSNGLGLLHFISIPVFLILAAIVMSRNSESPPPETVTGLFARIIEVLPNTENIQERDRIIEIINKLKKIAHTGMVQGRVIFYENDLTKHGLSIEDVRDLVIKVPGKNILSRYLLERHNYILCFFHQSFQEFLSACFITEMNLEEFKNFNSKSLHEDRWSVVRRICCGLIYDNNVSLRGDLHQIPDKNEIQHILRESLKSQHVNANGYQLLELYGALYESNNDDLVKSIIRQISLRSIPLGPDGAFVLSSMMARCENLDLVELHCMMHDNFLGIMAENLKGRKVEVKKFNIFLGYSTIAVFNSLLENMNIDTLDIETSFNELVHVGPAALDFQASPGEISHELIFMMIFEIQNIREVMLRDTSRNLETCQNDHIAMTKSYDSIDIIHSVWTSVRGTFYLQNRMLQIDVQSSANNKILQDVIDGFYDIKEILKPNSVTVALPEEICQQYFLDSMMMGLNTIQNWKFEGKIKQLLLSYLASDDMYELYSFLIVSAVHLLSVEVVNIVVDFDKHCVPSFPNLKGMFPHYGCELNIHYLYKGEMFQRSLPTSSERSLEDLSTFVKKCKVKKFTMILSARCTLSKSNEEKLMKTVESSEGHLEIRKCYEFESDIKPLLVNRLNNRDWVLLCLNC